MLTYIFLCSAIVNADCKYKESANGSSMIETKIHHTKESPVLPTEDMEYILLTYEATEQHIKLLLNQTKCKQHIQIDCSYYGGYIAVIGGIERRTTGNDQTSEECSCPYVNKCSEQ